MNITGSFIRVHRFQVHHISNHTVLIRDSITAVDIARFTCNIDRLTLFRDGIPHCDWHQSHEPAIYPVRRNWQSRESFAPRQIIPDPAKTDLPIAMPQVLPGIVPDWMVTIQNPQKLPHRSIAKHILQA